MHLGLTRSGGGPVVALAHRCLGALYVERGEEILGSGRVGYIMVAGGQGSRLGFEGPKGMFPVGPVSGASLFAWHARRLHNARERYGVAGPLLGSRGDLVYADLAGIRAGLP